MPCAICQKVRGGLGRGAGPGTTGATLSGGPAPSRPRPVQRKLPGLGTTDLSARMPQWVQTFFRGPGRQALDQPIIRGQLPGGTPGSFSLSPARIVSWRRPAFWAPSNHYVRHESIAPPPLLPGTAIPWTLFHPIYIGGGGVGPTSNGLLGWKGNLYWGPGKVGPKGNAADPRMGNFGWIWGRNNFAEFGSLAYLAERPVSGGTLLNVWKPAMKIPQGAGTGAVWQQPQPDYTPLIINPGGLGGRHRKAMGRA